MLEIPTTESAGSVHLFGDEAAEWMGPGFLYVYAFVSIHPDNFESVRAAVSSVKRAIRPNIEPERWIWHTWQIRDSRWRAQHSVPLNIREIDAQIRKLAHSIAQERDGSFLSATVFPPFDLSRLTRKIAETTVRNRALTGAICGITEFSTRAGITPHFTIEAQTLAHDRNQIDNFVEEIGRGLRYDLGYHYICRGHAVGLPVTTPKGASLELEIADLLAYFVRRFFHLGGSEDVCEVPLSLFGEILWGAFTPRRFGTHMSVGFPMNYFFSEWAATARSRTSG